ncbi:hypothetical protein RMCBS344292_12662 [Rhizopus microsporus]|nr:hypothetical protein RMCBS344292_12662 [Rhizopus microsporus]
MSQNILNNPTEQKTSKSHPIKISWIIPPDIQLYLSNNDLPKNHDLYDCMEPSIREQLLSMSNRHPPSLLKGNLCLSSCPGKKVRLSGPVRGRASINRDLDADLSRMKSFGITLIVCCLDDYEMELLGSPWPKYREIAAKNDIKVLRLPMIEGSCPETIEEAQHAIHIVNNEMNKGNNVLVHCRGGVGRAGLFACCWLLENSLCDTAERAIAIVRTQRSPKAIETLRQADYIIQYAKSLKQRSKLTEQHQTLTNTTPTMDVIRPFPKTKSQPANSEVAS